MTIPSSAPISTTGMANYSPASFDRRQVLVVNYVYTLPELEKFGNAWTQPDHQWLAALRRHHGADRRAVYALRQCPEFIQSDRHRVLYRRVAAGDRGGLQPLHGLRQLDQLFEPLVFRTGLRLGASGSNPASIISTPRVE